jgi:hypothetical protein
MHKTCFLSCVVVLSLAITALGQGSRDKNGVYQPSEEEIAKNKRIAEMLQHPTFITLRLASTRRDIPNEGSSATPSSYTEDQRMNFEFFITQNSSETLIIGSSGGVYYQYRPKLIRDGDVVAYSKEAQQQVERAEREGVPAYGSSFSRTLVPGRESRAYLVSLDSWYESPLRPGHYELTVRKRFAWNGDWVESNPVTFDVIPRKAASPIPDSVSLRLVPDASKPSSLTKPDHLRYDQGIAVELINDSDLRVPIAVIDRYYGHRPQLIKDGKVVPYSDESAKLVDAEEKDPRLVEVVSTFFLDPKTASRLDGFSLKQWYGPLAPGLYRLTDRRRFEIGGPWTKDSEALIFQVVP